MHSINNIEMACCYCNNSKNNRTEEEYIEDLKQLQNASNKV